METTMRAALLLGVLLFASVAPAASRSTTGVDQPPSRSASSPATDAESRSDLHAAIGVTGPVALQYTTFDLDFALAVPTALLPGKGWFIVPGLDLSLRSHRFALEPLVSVEHKWVRPVGSFAVVGYAGGGLGTNLGFNRGSTDWGLAFRGLGGGGLVLGQGFGLSTELALEVGPLIAPGAGFQGAIRWNIGGDFYF
jgi:hypothetical protein